MKCIFHRVLRGSPEKNETQSTNEILLSVIGGKKLRNVINFAFYWTILPIQGTLNASMMGSLDGGNFCSGSAAPLRVYDPLHNTTVRPCSASLSSNSKIVSHAFIVLMQSEMKTSSLRVPWKKPILLLRVQKAVNTNFSKRLIKDLP